MQRKSLDVSLGFAAGVMIAASFWSLLAPAIELAEASGTYGANGQFAFIPVAAGFFLGSIFVYGTDKIISYLGINSTSMMIGEYDWEWGSGVRVWTWHTFDFMSYHPNWCFNAVRYLCFSINTLEQRQSWNCSRRHTEQSRVRQRTIWWIFLLHIFLY